MHFLCVERVTELDAVVKDLETQLSEQEEEANSAIAVWQENWTALEERNAELVESMEIANEQSEKLKHEAVSAVTQKLNETETALAAAKEELAGADENTAKLQGKLTSNVCVLASVRKQFPTHSYQFHCRAHQGVGICKI